MPPQTSEHSIVLNRRIAATPQKIYVAWTQRQKMERWLGRVVADVRINGRYRFESPAEAGKTYVYTGEYFTLDADQCADQCVVQSFLAGEPDRNVSNPYSNAFIEIRLQGTSPGTTELTFINGWNGAASDEESCQVVRAAWTE